MHVVEEDGGKRRQKLKEKESEWKKIAILALYYDILNCLWFIFL